MGTGLPQRYINYIFYERRALLERLVKGEQISYEKMMLEFTRTTPIIVTCGPAGLSGSVKMVGFVPREEHLEELVRRAEEYAYAKTSESVLRDVSRVLLEEFYREDIIDFRKLGGLEMAFNHTWRNIKATGKATLVFYTPPNTSFEVRCKVEIHEDDTDLYKRYLNAMHDIFHKPRSGRSSYPAYVFIVEEIYDQSNTREGFGKKIYP